MQVDRLVSQATANEIAAEPGRTAAQVFEASINKCLNDARNEAGRIVSDSMPTNSNNLKLMVTAGSKGANVNIAQIAGVVGQQNVSNERIPLHFGHRSLPHVRLLHATKQRRN